MHGEVDSVCMERLTVYAWRGGQCMHGEVDSVCMERWTVYAWRGGQCMHVRRFLLKVHIRDQWLKGGVLEKKAEFGDKEIHV